MNTINTIELYFIARKNRDW